MAMSEMKKAITKIRFVLATVKEKERELAVRNRQFKRQLSQARSHALHGSASLDATLGIMGEIQERLDGVENNQQHLDAIKVCAQEELQALELTDRIEQAKTELKSLKAPSNSESGLEESANEKIQELERFIQEASIRAGQVITGEIDLNE